MTNIKLDFVGVGAPKCGTTWIGRMLNAHPDIDFAKSKETFYFLDENADVRSDVKGFRRTQNLDALANEFSGNGIIKGEFSTQYMFDENTLKNIFNHNPDIKIIIAIRHPIEFLYSAYIYDKNSHFGNELPDSFEKYLNNWSDKSLVRKHWAFFSKYIEMAYGIFPKENVLVIHHEKIKADNKSVLRELYSFLGVDPEHVPEIIHDKINETRQFRNPFFRALFNLIFKSVEFFRLEKLGRRIIHENQALRSLMFKLFKSKATKKALEPELKAKLSMGYEQEVEYLKQFF